MLVVDPLEVAVVLHCQVNQVVGIARHQVAGHHLGAGADLLLEVPQRFLALADQRHLHEHVQVPADGLGVKQHHVARDHAAGLQPAHPAVAGRRRQPYPVGQLGVRDPAVDLELVEDEPVNRVEFEHEQYCALNPL